MGSYIYPYARGVYPLFFLGRYMEWSFVQYPRPPRI